MENEPIPVPLDFSLVDETQIVWANYFLLQYGAQDGFVLSACQVRPPVILTDDEKERRRILQEMAVQVRPVVRVAVPRSKLRALARLIDRQLEKFPADAESPQDADLEGTSGD